MRVDIDVALAQMSNAEIVLMIEDVLDFAEKKNSRFYSALMEKIRETQVTKTKR